MAEHKRSALLIIFVTVFIDLLGFAIVVPLLPRYGEHFAASKLTLGLLMASFSAMQFLFSPLWGKLSDRVGRRPVLILGLAGSAVSYALFGLASSLHRDAALLGLSPIAWLFITRIGAGIAGATISTAQAYIADVTSDKERARGMALIGAAFGIGFTFGPILGAGFVSDDPTAPPSPYAGYVASALSALALLSAIFRLPESRQPGSASSAHGWFVLANVRRALLRPSISLILVASFVTTFAFAQFETTLGLLTKRLGQSDRHNYYTFAYIGLILAISQGFLVRRLVPRMGEYRMAMIGTVLMAAGMGGVALVAQRSSLALLYATLPIVVVGFSALTPSLSSLLSRRTDADEQGSVLGVGQGIAALARIFGPVAGIVAFGAAPSLPYWIAAAIMALSLLLIDAIRRGKNADHLSAETA